jgi:hypothetical protein
MGVRAVCASTRTRLVVTKFEVLIGVQIWLNVQTAVDSKNHLIVAHGVTNVGTDRHQLSQMAEQARAEMSVETLDAMADAAAPVPARAARGRRVAKILELAVRHKIPTIYYSREFAVNGGLMSYDTDRVANTRLLGNYAGRILNGAKPAELPVQQPTKFEFVINLKTAKALGLSIPRILLAAATELID